MRLTALLIALLFACMAFAPGPTMHCYGSDATPAVRALDVCHTAAGGMRFELPCLPCRPAIAAPLEVSGARPIHSDDFEPILLVFCDERPPKQLLQHFLALYKCGA